MITRTLFFLLLTIQIGFAQSAADNKKKQKVYLSLIKSIKSDFSETPIIFNIQKRVKIPKEVTANGPLKSIILKTSIETDSLIVTSLKRQTNFAIEITDLDDDSMVAKTCGACEKKMFINIYEPLDLWLNYYYVLLTKDKYHPQSFKKVYIPVKFSLLNNKNKSLNEYVKIYVFDINQTEPILKEVIEK